MVENVDPRRETEPNVPVGDGPLGGPGPDDTRSHPSVRFQPR
jgi:hypothetical protein